MARTVTNNQLEVGKRGVVDGYVVYSQVTRQTTDDERAAANKRRREANPKARDIMTNYTSMTIGNPTVRTLNPNAPTELETYLRESCYNSNSKNYTGLAFNALNKTKSLPKAYLLNRATGQYDPFTLEHELAPQTKVALSIRVFEANGNKGISLDGIYIDELHYAEGPAGNQKMAEDMAAYGITMNWTAQNAAPAVPAQPAVPAAPQGFTQPATQAPAGFNQAPVTAAPATQAQPVAPVAQGNPFQGGQMPAPTGFTSNKTY